MATLKEVYVQSLKDFESLTTKQAATLKNKGKEQGIAKLSMLFKSGKTLDQRIAEYEAAMNACDRASGKSLPERQKALKALDAARVKLNEGLKKNIADFTVQARDISSADAQMKAGFEVFISMLNSMTKRVKMEVEQKTGILAKDSGKQTVGGKLAADIKQVYLNLKKGCDETEALMKKLIAQPTKENFMAAFSSGTGPRSISVAVTNWKQFVLKVDPGIKSKLRADPEHLILKIFDVTQRKDEKYWDGKIHFAQAGFEARAKKEAMVVLDQVKLWRIMADDMKKLVSA